jgi:hypothetical protein
VGVRVAARKVGKFIKTLRDTLLKYANRPASQDGGDMHPVDIAMRPSGYTYDAD